MCTTSDDRSSIPRNAMRGLGRIARSVHRDERGAISILTVFAIFMFTILMGMVINVGRHVDDKLRMQNAADAAAYTGAVTLGRGMNALAFTNHLEAEIFALTAYMRTARSRDAEELVSPILGAWQDAGAAFESAGRVSGYEKFTRLGRAIQDKAPREQELVTAYGAMAFRHSELTLPALEHVLQEELIPRFQRAVVRMTPEMAALAVDEVARRYGRRVETQHEAMPLKAVLWRTDGQALGQADESDPLTRTLPAVDPSPFGLDGIGRSSSYYQTAREQRRELAHYYLELWIRDWLGPYFGFDGDFRPGRKTAKLSQFINLWRIFACGELNQLLEVEYPDRNLPHVIRKSPGASNSLAPSRTFVAVAYWPHLRETFPGVFRNPLSGSGRSDALTFAQASVFIPQPRLRCCPWLVPSYDHWGVFQGLSVNRDNWPDDWTLLNQNWMAKLVPATSPGLVEILRSRPPGLPNFRPPDLGSSDIEDIRRVSSH